jgi:hypothetical protein
VSENFFAEFLIHKFLKVFGDEENVDGEAADLGNAQKDVDADSENFKNSIFRCSGQRQHLEK